MLVDIETGWHMEDLIELQDRDCLWSRRTFRFHQLFRIKRLAHENVQDFAGARNAVTGDLCIVDIELGFAIAPITVVLEQGGRELRCSKPCGEKERAAEIDEGFHDDSIHQPIHPCHSKRSGEWSNRDE